MEIEVFNTMGFQAGDFVRVTMNDGSEEVIQLERGEIYMSAPERRNYTTGEVVPANPPSIVVQGNLERPEGRGIPIEDVFDVVFISRP
jgi:hypothetical protein